MDKKQAKPDATTPATANAASSGEEVGYQDPLQHLQVVAVESYERLSDAAGQLTEQVQGVYEASQHVVRKNPLEYALGAFALGCILGLLMSSE